MQRCHLEIIQADFRSGILCSNNYGTIENCAVENAVIKTKKKTEYDDEMTIKLRVHSALAGGNYGTIEDSFVKDITFDGDGDTYPLSQSFTGSHIENTYYLSEKAEDKMLRRHSSLPLEKCAAF